MRLREVFVLILLGIIISSGLPLSTSLYIIRSERTALPIFPTILSFYNESSPISIDGDDDFAVQASAKSWPGDGTRETPYVISGLNITLESTSGNLINISNTESHFQIKDSLLVGGSAGIRFDNVSFGAVVNTSIHDCAHQGAYITDSDRVRYENNTIFDIGYGGNGFYLVNVSHSIIANNTFRNSGSQGLLVDYGSNCTFIDNSIFGNHSTGLYLRDSNGHRIHHNLIYDNFGNGITLGAAEYCNITENQIYNNGNQGISLQQASHILVELNLIYAHMDTGIRAGGHYSIIRNNTVYNSGVHGIEIAWENCTVDYNLLYNNSKAGVLVRSKGTYIQNNTICMNNQSAIQIEYNGTTVQYNNFIDNGEFLDYTQIYDAFFDNIFDYNYWSDWTYPDVDKDLIVDAPYLLDGPAHNSDIHPRVFPFLDSRLHILSTPILQNLAEDAYHDQINFTWGPAGDTFGHEIQYSLYYSADGIDWMLIASDIDTTFFLWNISGIPDGLNYYAKIIASCSQGLNASSSLADAFEIRSHTLSAPSLTIVINGEPIFYETVLLNWTLSEDSYDHNVQYALYYSVDDGESWVLIVDNLTTNEYLWNVTGMPYSPNYRIKIVAICSEGLIAEDVSDTAITINLPAPNLYLQGFLYFMVAMVILIPVLLFVWRKRKS